MKNYLLGKESEQPFEITQKGVSREHARLTIDDNGLWTLTDLDSSNGTYIRNKDGDWERIKKKIITPTTYICLGPDNANGCKFYAQHVEQSDDYSKDFDFMEDMANDIESKLDNADQKAKNIRKLIALVSGIALLGSFVVPGDGLRMLLLRVGSLVSMISTLFFDPNKDKKQLKTLRDKLFGCPNPACSHTLSTKEVLNRRCSKCKVQG
jgi:hypothetical protein